MFVGKSRQKKLFQKLCQKYQVGKKSDMRVAHQTCNFEITFTHLRKEKWIGPTITLSGSSGSEKQTVRACFLTDFGDVFFCVFRYFAEKVVWVPKKSKI